MKKNNINQNRQNKMFYNENQWSPLNPEGKKQYDRDFLLQLQSLPLCLCKPSNLPNLDIIKNKAYIQRLADINRTAPMRMPPVRPFDPFMPQYARGGNPLRPKLPVYQKKIRYILNKLTPQNFQPLVEQVKKLPINAMKELEETIDLIFEKAIDEPRFCAHYAYMCKQLESIKVPLDDGRGVVSFRELLLEKCQKEFEQDEIREKNPEDKLKAMKVELQVEEQEEKMKMKRIGTITFLGELFQLNIIVEPIMHHCITKLLAEGEEESLECFCFLLKSVGKELDERGNKFGESSLMDLYFVAMQSIVEENNFEDKTLMDLYFVAIQKIIDKRLISSRVRRMLEDVIDLKKNNWIPREDENNLKIIDQTQKDAEKDTSEAPQAYQNIFSNSPPDDKQLCGRSVGVSEVHCTPTSKSMKGSYSVVDPSKLKLTRPNEIHNIKLGPGWPPTWRKGYLGGNRVSVHSDMKTALINRSTAASRELSPAHNSQLPATVRKTSATSRKRENLIKILKELNLNLESGPKYLDAKKVENQVNDGMAESTSALSLHGPDLSEEDIEKKTKPLIDEFLYTGDFEEAEICVMELASPNTVHNFIHYAINYVLDKSSQTRCLLGKLLCSLVKKNVVTLEDYKKGLRGILENIDDYAVDIPKILEYMGDILEPMVEDKLPLSFLKDALEPYIPSERAGKLISAVLHCAAKKKGTLKLGKLCKESGLQWLDILGTYVNMNDFITDNELGFTVSQSKVIPNTEISIEEIRTKLRELLENNEVNQSIFDYIDANVSPSVVSEPTFIRALVQEVHDVAITGTDSKCELDKATLMKRIPLLTRYIHHNEKLELQTLYAVQHLTTDLNQPIGLLREIFDILYDDDVITEETFKVWESSDDPAELEGKGAALNCVRGFFTWLREAEESGEEAEDKRQSKEKKKEERKAKPNAKITLEEIRTKLREKLEFTATQRKAMPNTKISVEEIRTKLRELLENNEANNSIFDYIDANVSPSMVSEPAFIRTLVQEVHKVAITGTGSKCEVDQATLKKRMPLLARYIDHKENLELQALYAVQHLTTDLNQPKGVLRVIFDILYDDDVITEETFTVWENSDDPAELEGKGAALNCVRGFFTWLRDAEESDEEVEDE